MDRSISQRTWTVAEAKAKLSEVLRLAEEEGPQRIGLRRSFVVLPERVWREKSSSREAVGPMANREHAAGDESRDSRPTCGIPS